MSIADIHRKYAGGGTADLIDHHSYDKLLNEGGFSHHIRTGEEPRSGYMVGLHNEQGGEEVTLNLKDLTPDHIAEHRERARRAFGDHPNMYQGGWIHDGNAYLDRSLNVSDLDAAKEMGHAHKQLAIWDVASKREVPLSE